MSIFSSLLGLTKAMLPGLDLVQSIFSSLSRLTTLVNLSLAHRCLTSRSVTASAS